MRKLIVLTALATVAIAVPAVAAATFSGTTKQGLPVSLDVGASKVTNFKAKVRCVGSKVQTFKFKSIPLSNSGRFSVHQAGPSVDGVVLDNTAKGTLTLPGCDAKSSSIKFTARG